MVGIEVIYQDHMGDDLSVIKAAKESFNRKADWGDAETKTLKPRDQDLLRMLARGMGHSEYVQLQAMISKAAIEGDFNEVERLIWKFRHTTPHLAPFGHCYASFRFRAPVFVMRHIVKHEYIRISELSMRYVREMPEYFKPKSWRVLAESIKQGSGDDLPDIIQREIDAYLDASHHDDARAYEQMIDREGATRLCPEQARTFLRLCHMTEGTFSGSMDALSGIVVKRLDPHAQEETREFARQLDAHMFKLYPKAWDALTEGVNR